MNGVKKHSIIYSFLFTVICGIFGQFQLVYMSVDNYYISLVTNCVYDSDNYCMFLNPVLCWIVGGLQKISSEIDWLTFFCRVTILLGVWCLGWLMAVLARSKKEIVIGYVILFMLVVNASLFFDNFTIWASFFTFVGVTILLLGIRDKIHSKIMILLSALYISLGIIWRIESVALFLPFVLLELAIEMLFVAENHIARKQMLRKICGVIWPSLLCAVLLLGIDYSYKSSETYAERVAFYNAAGTAADFPMKDYESVKGMLSGVSKNDYESLQERLYADTDRINLEYCSDIKDIGLEDAYKLSFTGILNSNLDLLSIVFQSKKTMLYGVVLFVFLIWIFLTKVKWYYKLELLLSYVGAYLILIYFSFVGRIPLRVINAVLYAVFAIVFCMYFAEEWEEDKYKLIWLKKIFCIMILGIACVDTMTYEYIGHQSLFQVKDNVDEDKWSSTYEGEDIYLWRSEDFVQYPLVDFMHQGKFLTEDFMNHNLSYGGWTYGQLYYENYLARLGIPNPMRALLERENTYYVAKNMENVLIYLREHFDARVQVEQVKEINGIPVWRFLL